jgi:hypothetical protein
MSTFVWSLGLMVLLTVGLSPVTGFFIYRGYKIGRRYRRLRETNVETADTVRPGETAFVRGTVRASGDTVTGPVSGDEAVLAGWVIREWCSTNSRYWMTKARGIEAGDIHLDGSGRSLALPDVCGREQTGTRTRLAGTGDPNVEGLELHDTVVEIAAFDTDTEVPTAESPPSRVTALEGSVGLDEPVNNGVLDLRRADGTRNYRELSVDAGDTLTVRGRLAAPDQPGAAPSLSPPEDGNLFVSTLSPDELVRRYRWAYWKSFYGTLFATMLPGVLVGVLVYI